MTYEFTCRSCKQHFEEVRAVSQRNAPARCPQCGSKKTHRLLASRNVTANTGRGSLIPGPCTTLDENKTLYIKNKAMFREECKKRGQTPVNL